MSKIEEIKKIKKELEESLSKVDQGESFQEIFYALYDDWVKMKGEISKEQEKRRAEFEEKYGERDREFERECKEVDRAYNDIEKALERKVKSLSEEVERSNSSFHGLKSAYRKAYKLNPMLSEFTGEDQKRLDQIDEGIAEKKAVLRKLKELSSSSKASAPLERGEE